MDMTCRCKKDYTCVACKVKRGDYKDWMLYEGTCSSCGDPCGPQSIHCRRCYLRLGKEAKIA